MLRLIAMPIRVKRKGHAYFLLKKKTEVYLETYEAWPSKHKNTKDVSRELQLTDRYRSAYRVLGTFLERRIHMTS